MCRRLFYCAEMAANYTKKPGNICATYAFEMIGLSFGSDLTWHYQKSRRLMLMEKQKNKLCLSYEGQWKEGG